MQLLKMTIDLNEKQGLFFYLDMNSENLFLSVDVNKMKPRTVVEAALKEDLDLLSDFRICLGSLKNAFRIFDDRDGIVNLYPSSTINYGEAKKLA